MCSESGGIACACLPCLLAPGHRDGGEPRLLNNTSAIVVQRVWYALYMDGVIQVRAKPSQPLAGRLAAA